MASHIVTYLRRERRKWGLTQEELASLLGLKSRGNISALENGKCQPTARELLALQLIFGMTASQLFPELATDIESAVLSRVRELLKTRESPSTLRAQRKNILLRQIPSRAVMS